MDRRTALRAALALSTASVTGLSMSRVSAQSDDLTAEMIEERPWLEFDVFLDLRRLAAVVIELRIVYEGPNGYEAEPPFVEGAFDVWRRAFGETGVVGWQRAQAEVVPALDRTGDSLKSELDDLLSENVERFVSWLAELGIEPGSQLQVDLLRAQALFAVTASVLLADGQPREFSEFTWIFPFC